MKEPLIPSKDRSKIEKYWRNDWMFAYVSDDVLKIIYSDVDLSGKVICCGNYIYYGYAGPVFIYDLSGEPK